ncbi:hypothetical protein AVEN_214226-1 [Araneus ventricosus]|uniref:Uncharacterized protein n=1 Tax=Araneus ventricosus TaxID=182803 RepID=A0A4Y2D3V0_ARAVE|nr:hypothetical protein AVEN_190436-1 [Araneus ventricosus]GBM11352.1 hypothetical protein AVEN_41521-1 [Araneus ventricosus]GBM11400.1 hypothetical protein AVEN_74456-1 [Araneus ventricosus]GBM11458.1 hypothetical protein AVEN_214226-1 [Araneus ventricosus]
MLQHLYLVWLSLVRPENVHHTALDDYHFAQRHVESFLSYSWSSLLALVLTTFMPCHLWSSRSACIGDGTCAFEFHDEFYHGVMSYLCSVRCIESRRYMTGDTTPSQQNPFFNSLVAFQLVNLPQNGKEINRRFHHLYGDLRLALYCINRLDFKG